MAQDSGKYWIKPGIKVQRRDGGPVMEVLGMNTYSYMDKHSGLPFTRVTGVGCCWIDESGQWVTEEFHTKDLVPAHGHQ